MKYDVVAASGPHIQLALHKGRNSFLGGGAYEIERVVRERYHEKAHIDASSVEFSKTRDVLAAYSTAFKIPSFQQRSGIRAQHMPSDCYRLMGHVHNSGLMPFS